MSQPIARIALLGSGTGSTTLLVTDLPKSFDATASRFLGGDVPGAEQVDL